MFPNEKKRGEGETLTSMRYFKCGEYGHHAPECKCITLNCFKCGNPGNRVVDCRSNNLTFFNCGDKGHVSTQCEKPDKTQS